jgi:hypothetical protein
MNRCYGITEHGVQCKRKINTNHCFQHLKTECPICYEENTRLIFKCHHSVCKTCVKQMYKTECPLCRRDFSTEVPKYILKKIEENKLMLINEKNDEFLEPFRLFRSFIKNPKSITVHCFDKTLEMRKSMLNEVEKITAMKDDLNYYISFKGTLIKFDHIEFNDINIQII